MSNIWISAATPPHVPGPQAVTAPTEQKDQAAYSVSSFNYTMTLNAQTAPAEPNKPQAAYSVTSFNYA